MTQRRVIRPRVRYGQKSPLYGVPHRVLREVRFLELPLGVDDEYSHVLQPGHWLPGQYPLASDLPAPPLRKKRKRRMPASVRAEIREFHLRTAQLAQASGSVLSMEDDDPQALWDEAEHPAHMSQDADLLPPIEEDEWNLGLDDPLG